MPDNKTYRIKANIQGEDYVDLNLNLVQDINVFEFLSLKMDSENLYRLHTSNYGCVAGRVLANNSVGVPNVKISIFIAADEETKADSVLSYLYPYDSTADMNNDGIRYNLLPEEQLFVCHQNVGTFPSKRMVLDDNNVFEIFDKYYKFTTTTNSAGDYMIFGVPVGTQILHMDVDLSDIGDLLSQRPKDFIYKGYNVNQFENANMFKKDTNLGSLTQLFTQNESVDVKPFWGEADEMGEIDSTGVRITRKDINLNYKFEPTCVFMGSLITDEKSNGFTKKCIPTERMGKMDRLTTGEGTIEMIRKKPDGSVEEFTIMGNQLIDGNGTWCYQIPMNLDYVMTDEYGNIVPTNNMDRGLPTRARVRFRFSLNDFASDYQNNHLSKMLVPNNPQTKSDMQDAYIFGTKTPDEEFRDLFWNKVYSVKSYIPRIQKSNTNREKRFSGIKAVNVNVGNNPIPYNNMRIDITFMFVLQCAIMHILIWIAGVVNNIIYLLLSKGGSCGEKIAENFNDGACVTVGDGACPDLDGWYFAPKCSNEKLNKNVNPMQMTLAKLEEREYGVTGNGDPDILDKESINYENKPTREESSICLTNRIDYFVQCIEVALAQEYDVIQFDFYNDWMNGMLYIPRWFANIKKKRKYLFGLIGPKKAHIQACMENEIRTQRRYVQQCALGYEKEDGKYTKVTISNGCSKNGQRCHKGKGRKNIKILKNTYPGGGLVHDQQTTKGQYAYYFRPCDWYENKKVNYFATDLILLGSLSVHDMDGIPQTFKELSSSSYQMPTNLAATNMDTIANMYGATSEGDSLCNSAVQKTDYAIAREILDKYPLLNEFWNNNPEAFWENLAILHGNAEDRMKKGLPVDEQTMSGYEAFNIWVGYAYGGGGVTKYPQTFEAYKTWASKSDFNDDLENDPDEYEVTEASGIDWGYTGPGQGNNNFGKLYQPGGHFLGIACFNAESNVKSCVNLSRVCELGAMISQRQAVIRRNGVEASFETDFLIPTGFISKDEISDTSFRSEFATLNHNRLIATKLNPMTNRLEYDFVSMLPSNFDGVFGDKVSRATEYNNLTGFPESPNSKGYTRTIEDASVDYYDFRFGVGNSDWVKNGTIIEDKYMKFERGRAYLPMYNNSYYFYFGLHDGSTALDRFYKEYFAECPALNEGTAMVRIFTEDTDPCSENPYGKAVIYFAGVSTRPDNNLSYTLTNSTRTIEGTVPPNATELEIGGLEMGDYEITFTCEDIEDFSQTFRIGEKIPDFLSDIAIDIDDFTKQKYDTDVSDHDGRGSVTVYIPNSLTGVELSITGSIYNNEPLPNNTKVYLPDGDADYVIKVKYCGKAEWSDFYRFTPSMPHEFDLLIGGSTQVTYNRTVKSLGNNATWWEDVLSNGSDLEKFFVERAITFKGSRFNNPVGSIMVDTAYGNVPYVMNLDGNSEMLSGGTVNISDSSARGYSFSYGGFYIPTRNNVSDEGYVVNGTKGDYEVVFKDSNGMEGCSIIPESGKLTLPSIYKPFFFRCIIFRNVVSAPERDTYSIAIANGTLYDNKFSSVSVCGNEVLNVNSGNKSWWNNNGGNIEDYPICSVSGVSSNRANGTYSVSIKENEPDNNFPVFEAKEMDETITFIGDGTKNPDSRVRYFLLCRSTVNGTRQNISSNPQYSQELERKLQDKLCHSDNTSIKDGPNDANHIYWTGSCTKAFTIALDDGGYLIFNPSNEIDRNAIFSGDISVIDQNDRKQDCFVLGIYDPWTGLDDADFKAAQNPNFGGRYSYVGKDTDMLTVMKLYTVPDFIQKVENPEMYNDVDPSGSDTDNTTIKMYYNDVVYLDLTAQESTSSSDKNERGTDVVSEFDVPPDNQYNYVIRIPEINFRSGTSNLAHLDAALRFRLVNEDTGDEKILSWYEPSSFDTHGYAHYDRMSGLNTFHTTANDATTVEMGYGGYKLYFDYDITLHGTYNQDSDGYVEFNGGEIHITRMTNG